MSNLILTKKHVRRLQRLNRSEGAAGTDPGDVRRGYINAALIEFGYARKFLPWNLSHKLRIVITEKGRDAINTEEGKL